MSRTTPLRTLALFCKVVDNYGDIGICWRLARQLQHEHQIQVQLWVDDLTSFHRICPELNPSAQSQYLQGIEVRWWEHQELVFETSDIADIVIEFFACDIPPSYVTAMSQCEPRPVWFNLEGLTAEDWVEGCHRLPSSHPRLPLTKHFFFPGFNQRTGGLMFEANLEHRRNTFLANRHARSLFSELGATQDDLESIKISLFCYPHAPLEPLLQAWSNGKQAILLLVPEGVARASLESFLGCALKAGNIVQKGNLRVLSFPFLAQDRYDELLWACDFNFVRGEDSFVRAQWAQKPFVWHIYPQDENLHHKKLRAFLAVHSAQTEALQELMLAWNEVIQVSEWENLWQRMLPELHYIEQKAQVWAVEKQENGDLSANLLDFARKIREKSE